MYSPDEVDRPKRDYFQALDFLDAKRFFRAYEILKRLYDSDPYAVEAGFVELHLGHCCYYLGYEDSSRWDEGLNFLEQAFERLDRKTYGREFIVTCDLAGGTLWFLERNEEALRYLQEGLPYLQEYDADCAAYYLILLGRVYLYLQKYEDALDYLRKTKQYVPTAVNRDRIETELNFEFGRVYHRLCDNIMALKYLESVDLTLLKAMFESNYFLSVMRVNAALKRFPQVLSAFKSLREPGNIPDQAEAYWLVGYAYYMLQEPEKALEWYGKSLNRPTKQSWIHERALSAIDKIYRENPALKKA